MNKATSPTGWAKNPNGSPGWTWNPITGCLNHNNGLCKGGGFPCYAFKLAHGRLKPLYLANKNGLPYSIFEKSDAEELKAETAPFYPRFWEERLKELEDRHTHNNRFSKPIGCFVCDMGDLFGIGVPEEWTRRVLNVISKQMTYPAENDHFYLLTKQPQKLIKFSPFPDNAWVGVTATNAKMLKESLMHLEEIKASIKYVSLEPLLERVYDWIYFLNALPDFLSVIDWLIIGACTGTWRDMVALSAKYPELAVMKWGKKWTAQPRIEWISEIVQAADRAGVKVFLKDNLKPLIEWPRDDPWAFDNLSNIPRQEMPE